MLHCLKSQYRREVGLAFLVSIPIQQRLEPLMFEAGLRL